MNLNVSRIFSDAFGILRSRIGLLLGLWVVFLVLQIVMFVVFGGGLAAGFAGAAGADGSASALSAGIIFGMVLFYIAYILVSVAQSASLNHMASPLVSSGFGESLSVGFRSAPTLLAVVVILIIAYFIAAIPLGIVIGLLAMAGPVAGLLVAILIIPAAIYLACRLSVLSPVVAVDRTLNPITALTRTWQLTRGNVLPIFLVYLVFGAIALVVMFALASPLFGLISNAQAAGTPPDFSGVGAFTMVALFIAFLVFSLVSAAIVSAIHAGLVGHVDHRAEDIFS